MVEGNTIRKKNHFLLCFQDREELNTIKAGPARVIANYGLMS